MMKKVYIAPSTEEFKVNMESLLSGGSITQNGDQVTINGFDEEEYSGKAGSRYYDDWD